jgi:predicted ester cyclase
MSTKKNKTLIRQFFDALNRRDMSAFALFTPDAVHHNPFPGTPPGREGNKQGILILLAGFPDWHTTIDDLVAEGDKVVVRMTQQGTHQGALFGILPTGKRVTAEGVAIFRMRHGQIVEEWLVTDQLRLLQELGVVQKGAWTAEVSPSREESSGEYSGPKNSALPQVWC